MTTLKLRRASERGHFDHGWLNTFHTFSFADYYDPKFRNYSVLLVINDDTVAPGHGFGMHPHRDMEILTYVLSGAVAHKDSMGNTAVVRPGEVQRMTAGTGVRHSEQNPSPTEPLHLLQIWILPDKGGYPPSYEQKPFPVAERAGRFRLVASPDGADGSVTIHQDARLYIANLDGQSTTYELPAGRHTWIHVARGNATVDDTALAAGDAVSTSGPATLTVRGDGAEVLLFDLP